jgi:HlyD family secretion protein
MKSNLDLRQLAVHRDPVDKPAVAARRHILSRYVVPLGLLLGFLGVAAWAARDVYLPRRPVTVLPVLASRAKVQESGTPLFKASGWVEPRPIPIRVSTLSSGVVKQLLVVEDQYLGKDDPVAYLVDDDAKLALNRATAMLDLQQAELDLAEAEYAAAKTNLEYPLSLQAAVADAEANLARVVTTLESLPFTIEQARAEQKFAKQDVQGKKNSGQVVAGIELDRAQSKLDAAQAKIDELQKQLQFLGQEKKALSDRQQVLVKQLELKTEEKRAVQTTAAKVEAARARVQEAKTAVAEARLRLERMTITAPVDGRVLYLLAAPGTHVTAGVGLSGTSDPSTVVTMYRPDSLQVRVDVRFDDLPHVQPGLQQVEIASPALAAPVTGKVLFISSLADIQKNTLEVKVALDSPQPILKPDMLVDVTFLAPPQENAQPSHEQHLYVPKHLVQSDESGKYVWVADTFTGTARKQVVQTGRPIGGDLIEITKGLSMSSRLIVDGRDGLQDGARIHVTGEDATLGMNGHTSTSEKNDH